MPSDVYVFGQLKKHLPGKQFAVDADMKQAVTS
jgi:type III secretory pathway component EscV